MTPFDGERPPPRRQYAFKLLPPLVPNMSAVFVILMTSLRRVQQCKNTEEETLEERRTSDLPCGRVGGLLKAQFAP